MDERHDVVVVGAGPAGLVAAAELARAGIDVLVVERRPAGSDLPRATVLSVRTMELMRAWGLEGRIREQADDVEMTLLELPLATRADEGTRHEVGLPSPSQSRVVSPTEALCVAQDHLEDVLTGYLASLPTASMRRGVQVVDVHDAADHAVLVCVDGGSERRIAADYVIGADGARSSVRAAIGARLLGPEVLMENISVEFRAPVWDVLGPHRHVVYTLTEPGSSGVLLPAGKGDRWLFGFQYGYALEPGADPTTADLRDHIERAIGVPGLDIRIERVGRYTSSAQLADRFSDGRVHLVGDAAHRVTPRGGTGLNIAIADGHDLGWKLGWVLRGWAPDTLLATYASERRPAVTHNVERSADPLGSRREVISELLVDLGGRIGHAWTGDGSVSTLDLLTDGLTLFTSGPAGGWARAAGGADAGGPPVAVVPLDPVTARSLGLGPSGAVLVRPDGRAVASWSSGVHLPDAREAVVRAAQALTHPSPIESRDMVA